MLLNGDGAKDGQKSPSAWSVFLYHDVGELVLTLPAPYILESWFKIKINLNFCFHTSLLCLKKFYKGLKGLYKTFWGNTKKCENKN